MKRVKSEAIDLLFEAVLGLESIDECYDFFEDICTIKEVKDMAQRLEVAMLLDAKKNYQEIAEKTTVSTATISRVSKCLNYGSGGYRRAIDRLGGEKK